MFMSLSILLSLNIVMIFFSKNCLNLFVIILLILYIISNFLKVNSSEPLKLIMKTLIINIVMYLILIGLLSLFFGNFLVESGKKNIGKLNIQVLSELKLVKLLSHYLTQDN